MHMYLQHITQVHVHVYVHMYEIIIFLKTFLLSITRVQQLKYNLTFMCLCVGEHVSYIFVV